MKTLIIEEAAEFVWNLSPSFTLPQGFFFHLEIRRKAGIITIQKVNRSSSHSNGCSGVVLPELRVEVEAKPGFLPTFPDLT